MVQRLSVFVTHVTHCDMQLQVSYNFITSFNSFNPMFSAWSLSPALWDEVWKTVIKQSYQSGQLNPLWQFDMVNSKLQWFPCDRNFCFQDEVIIILSKSSKKQIKHSRKLHSAWMVFPYFGKCILKKMQLDVGNEPYLSQQKPISYVSTGLSINVSDELAEDCKVSEPHL